MVRNRVAHREPEDLPTVDVICFICARLKVPNLTQDDLEWVEQTAASQIQQGGSHPAPAAAIAASAPSSAPAPRVWLARSSGRQPANSSGSGRQAANSAGQQAPPSTPGDDHGGGHGADGQADDGYDPGGGHDADGQADDGPEDRDGGHGGHI